MLIICLLLLLFCFEFRRNVCIWRNYSVLWLYIMRVFLLLLLLSFGKNASKRLCIFFCRQWPHTEDSESYTHSFDRRLQMESKEIIKNCQNSFFRNNHWNTHIHKNALHTKFLCVLYTITALFFITLILSVVRNHFMVWRFGF